jgi:hypothetical protein
MQTLYASPAEVISTIQHAYRSLQGEIAIKSGTDAVPGQDRNVYTWCDHPIHRTGKDLF